MNSETIEAIGSEQLTLQPGDTVRQKGSTFLVINPAQVEATLKPKAETQETYLIKVSCPSCGYTARVTKKWLHKAGRPIELGSGILCMECNVALIQKGNEETA